MTITIESINVTPDFIELSGPDVEYLFDDDYDEQIEARQCTFRFDRKIHGNLVYLNRILTSRKCEQPTCKCQAEFYIVR